MLQRRSNPRLFAIQIGGLLALAIGSSSSAADLLDSESARFLRERKWDDAILSLKRLERRDPSVEVKVELSRAMFYSGRREESVALLQRTMKSARSAKDKDFLAKRVQIVSRLFYTQTTFLMYQEGLHLLEARKLRAARDRFEQALAQEPDNLEILVRLAQAQALSSDPDSSSERLRLAKKLNPEDPEIRLWLGRALFFRGEIVPALDELRAAHQQMSESEESALWLAEALISSGQRGSAVQMLEKHLQRYPMHLQALVYFAEQRYEAAGKDSQSLWAVRKDLQLVRSRLNDYLNEKRSYPSDSLHLDLRNATELKQTLDALSQKVDAKLSSGSRPVAES